VCVLVCVRAQLWVCVRLLYNCVCVRAMMYVCTYACVDECLYTNVCDACSCVYNCACMIVVCMCMSGLCTF
jgi:hypothetical protein